MSFFKWLEKDPLEAAAMTAAVVGTGGAAAPAVAGAEGATALGLDGMAGAAGATGSGLLTTAAPASGGLMASAAPYMQAMGAASQAKGLLSSPQQAAPQVSNHTDGGAGLSQLYASIQQGDAQRAQEEMQKRMKTQGLFGGGNGWTA